MVPKSTLNMAKTAGIGTFIDDAHELATDSLDFFSVPRTESALIHGKNQEYYLTGPLTDTGPYEFIVHGDSNEYVMLDKMTIYGEVSIVKAGGAAIGPTDNVSVINNFPQALFSQIEVYLQGQCINDLSTPTYPYKAFIENHLTYDDDIKNTTLAATEIYMKDTLKLEKDVTEAMKDKTSGMYLRAARCSKKVCFDIVPHIDFLRSKKYLLPGVEMRIKLTRAPDSFALIQAANTASIKFHKLELHTRKVTLDPKIAMAVENKLATTPAIYPVTASKIRTHLLPQGNSNYTVNQIVRGKLPRSFMFCIMESDRFDGGNNINSFYFNNNGCNSIQVLINGDVIHASPMTPKWNDGVFLKEYRWFLDNIGLHQNFSNGITAEEFATNSCFYCYDLSPDLCNGFYKHGLEQGVIDLRLGFETALAKNHVVLFFATFEESILIDKERNITVVN